MVRPREGVTLIILVEMRRCVSGVRTSVVLQGGAGGGAAGGAGGGAEGGAGGGAEGGAEEAPTITMPGASKPRAPYYADYDDPPQDNHQQPAEREETGGARKQEGKPKEEGKGKGSGWLGGILTKLSLRPPNQMILPDDKNPTIVWDAEHKRWRNLDGDADASEPPPPPPTAAQLPPALRSTSPPLSAPPGAPPAAPVSNIFKMQKGRHIKKSYVDVFNPGGAARPLPPAGEVLGPAPPPLAPANYFVPAPLPNESESLPNGH